MSAVVIIHAHQEAEPVFNQHMPLWESHGFPIVVMKTPGRNLGPYPNLEAGPNGRCNINAMTRLKFSLNWFCDTGYTHGIFFEYDSFCLDKHIPLRMGLRCIVGVNTEPSRFMSKRYALFPWVLDRESAIEMTNVSNRYPDVIEECADDRLAGAWAMLAGIPLLGHSPPGYAMNTIEPEHYPDAILAVQRGARYFHGIKDDTSFKVITSAWKS